MLGVLPRLQLGVEPLQDALGLALREVAHVVVLRRRADQPAVCTRIRDV